MKLEGKKALITEGNSGIGFATARLFIREGAEMQSRVEIRKHSMPLPQHWISKPLPTKSVSGLADWMTIPPMSSQLSFSSMAAMSVLQMVGQVSVVHKSFAPSEQAIAAFSPAFFVTSI